MLAKNRDLLPVYGLAKAAASEKLFTGKSGGVFRGEKDSDGGDVAGLADAAERSPREDGLLEIRCDEAAAVGTFSLDYARTDGIDPDHRACREAAYERCAADRGDRTNPRLHEGSCRGSDDRILGFTMIGSARNKMH